MRVSIAEDVFEDGFVEEGWSWDVARCVQFVRGYLAIRGWLERREVGSGM